MSGYQPESGICRVAAAREPLVPAWWRVSVFPVEPRVEQAGWADPSAEMAHPQPLEQARLWAGAEPRPVFFQAPAPGLRLLPVVQPGIVSGLFFYPDRLIIRHECFRIRIFFGQFLCTGNEIGGRRRFVFFLEKHVKTNAGGKDGKDCNGNQETRLIATRSSPRRRSVRCLTSGHIRMQSKGCAV